MRFSFYAAAAIAAVSVNATKLQQELDDVFSLIQVADQIANGLPHKEIETFGQLISEMESEDQDLFGEDADLAQTVTSMEQVQGDLDTIANYIVHLREDQIHHIAERVKVGEQPTVMKMLANQPEVQAIRQIGGSELAKAGAGAGPGPRVVSLGAGPRPGPGPKIIALGGPGPSPGSGPRIIAVKGPGGPGIVRAGPPRVVPKDDSAPRIQHLGSKVISTGRLLGDHEDAHGDRLRMQLQGRQNVNVAQAPGIGPVLTVTGDEGADIKRQDGKSGQTTGIRYLGKGGLGLHKPPGENTKVAMFANAGVDGTVQERGGAPKGVGIRMRGDMFQDPDRNINHLDRDLKGGLIGIRAIPAGAALV